MEQQWNLLESGLDHEDGTYSSTGNVQKGKVWVLEWALEEQER